MSKLIICLNDENMSRALSINLRQNKIESIIVDTKAEVIELIKTQDISIVILGIYIENNPFAVQSGYFNYDGISLAEKLIEYNVKIIFFSSYEQSEIYTLAKSRLPMDRIICLNYDHEFIKRIKSVLNDLT